ncbi:MAG: hypothetical protein E7016_05395 [Alphaproteobacteria bacterium]|nr:hypothetical protein [Alphaproteobacteria bacterium]
MCKYSFKLQNVFNYVIIDKEKNMNKNSLYVSLLALAVSAGAVVMANKKCDEKAAPVAGAVSEKEVAAILDNNPQLIVNALQKFEQMQREEEERQAAKLFLENIDELQNDANTPFVGPKDAKVVLVEFFDFNCGYCKRIAGAMEKVVNNNPDVKVVFKPLTFLGSKPIAQAAYAAYEQGKFIEAYKAFLNNPERLDEAKINEIVAGLGLDMDKFKADVNSDKTKEFVEKTARFGNKVQVRGVPSLVLNGKKLNVIDYEGIQAAIDAAK